MGFCRRAARASMRVGMRVCLARGGMSGRERNQRFDDLGSRFCDSNLPAARPTVAKSLRSGNLARERDERQPKRSIDVGDKSITWPFFLLV